MGKFDAYANRGLQLEHCQQIQTHLKYYFYFKRVEMALYQNYIWKYGIPVGLGSIPPASPSGYKIISDPYRRRISIEKYQHSLFDRVIYDSALINFRHLKNPEQTAWQKTMFSSDIAYIRNEDDRLIFIETYQFKEGLCTECRITSPHGVELSVHKMYYKKLHDRFNGVILYDVNEHPVMYKDYDFDELNKQFTTLLREEWDMEKHPPHG